MSQKLAPETVWVSGALGAALVDAPPVIEGHGRRRERAAVVGDERVGEAHEGEHRDLARRHAARERADRDRERDGRGGGEQVGRLAREPVGHRAAVREAGGVDAPRVDRRLFLHPRDQRADERDVVVRGAAADPAVPGVAQPLRPGRDEAARVGQGQESGHRALHLRGRREPVHVDHERNGRAGVAGRHVHQVGASRRADHDRPRRVPGTEHLRRGKGGRERERTDHHREYPHPHQGRVRREGSPGFTSPPVSLRARR